MARKITGRHSKKLVQATLGLRIDATALYIRVSTQSQADEGYSLAAQEKELREYCQSKEWPVSDEHIYVEEGISGKSIDGREKFQAMMQATKDGQIKRVVATKLDRIARNLKDLLDIVARLKANACDLIILDQNFDTSTASGVFFLQMMGAIAELERSMISDRVMTGKRQNASEGGFNGSRVPYGYIYQNNEFTLNEKQVEVVKTIFNRFINNASLNSIAIGLNDDGIPSPTGKKWSHVGIRHMLANSFYAGLAEWNDIKGEKSTHPAIVDKDVYEAAVERLKTLSKGNPDFGKKSTE